MSTLRVVTWNVLHTNRHQRVGLLAAAVATRRPDFVLLQESSPRHAEDLAAELGMHVAAVPDDAADLVSVPAVLSTREPSEVRVDCLAGDDGRNYYLTTAVLEVDSTRIRVGSTHLRHTPSAWQMTETGRRFARDSGIRIDFGAIEATTAVRLRQLAEIGDLLHRKMEPVDHEILGGDFNLVPDSPEYAAIIEDRLRDSWNGATAAARATVLARNPLVGDTPAHLRSDGPAARALDYTLDYQFHSSGMEVVCAEVIGEPDGEGAWPSDHLGLSVDYTPADRGASGTGHG
ncbi:endonuclease/exonuclease/phosphatase family metal-dependent hydrolase [Rhodococcus sp. AG1013]|uniref:endonuclease/exonuclease/phosphatase family protein n=1 Tax=Rhodococcus sp. AG1013 TaxID=2183996 RepID=UPI000E2A6378|nr:endonuclease/exonuclease/phosphatase family protein [Rhodococcus sp. AG1013]RDI35851.1 endonuclease/exonuclease/phosphatase family metal-dependent hydrolase [Rhodococcus sp. AG1013]